MNEVKTSRIPRHIAFIMDGNGRWAEAQGLPRIEGHRQGAETVRMVTEACAELGVETITLYCLSSENWKRPQHELDFLMSLLEEYLLTQRGVLMENDIVLRVIGRRDRLPAGVQRAMGETIQISSANRGMKLVLAIDYGGRAEIANAASKAARLVQAGEFPAEAIDEHLFARFLDTAGLPDPDLMIRTGGDFRVSNFLLWQLSYAELWVTPRAWPEFRRCDLDAAVADFAERERRFGGLLAHELNDWDLRHEKNEFEKNDME